MQKVCGVVRRAATAIHDALPAIFLLMTRGMLRAGCRRRRYPHQHGASALLARARSPSPPQLAWRSSAGTTGGRRRRRQRGRPTSARGRSTTATAISSPSLRSRRFPLGQACAAGQHAASSSCSGPSGSVTGRHLNPGIATVGRCILKCGARSDSPPDRRSADPPAPLSRRPRRRPVLRRLLSVPD